MELILSEGTVHFKYISLKHEAISKGDVEIGEIPRAYFLQSVKKATIQLLFYFLTIFIDGYPRFIKVCARFFLT